MFFLTFKKDNNINYSLKKFSKKYIYNLKIDNFKNFFLNKMSFFKNLQIIFKSVICKKNCLKFFKLNKL